MVVNIKLYIDVDINLLYYVHIKALCRKGRENKMNIEKNIKKGQKLVNESKCLYDLTSHDLDYLISKETNMFSAISDAFLLGFVQGAKASAAGYFDKKSTNI